MSVVSDSHITCLSMAVSVIVATTPKGGIGKDGELPWKIPEDMAHFKRMTTATTSKEKTNAVIMGRKTWQSIPEKFRPLTDRVNVVLTSAAAEPNYVSPYPDGVLVASSVASASEKLRSQEDVEEIFVIGGQAAYKEAVEMDCCRHIFMTRIGTEFECDAFFPAFDATQFNAVHVSTTQNSNGLPYDFIVYERREAASKVAAWSQVS